MQKPTLPDEHLISSSIKDLYAQFLKLNKTNNELHLILQKSMLKLSSKFSFTATKEYILPKFRGDRDGRIDVVWTVGLIPVVAFEIDRRCRTKSIKKLLASNSNMQFWVYFGNKPFEPFVKTIDPTSRIKIIHLKSVHDKTDDHRDSISPLEVENQILSSSMNGFTKLRLKYPNAYEIWSTQQDENLKNNFLNGMTINELAQKFQRKPSAIRSRIKKLGLRYS